MESGQECNTIDDLLGYKSHWEGVGGNRGKLSIFPDRIILKRKPE